MPEDDTLFILHDHDLVNLDIVVINGNFDGLGTARWLFGLASARAETSTNPNHNAGSLTKASGPDFGTRQLRHRFGGPLLTRFSAPCIAPHARCTMCPTDVAHSQCRLGADWCLHPMT